MRDIVERPDLHPADAFAQQVEGWGYGALWIPESRGRNALVLSSFLLASTRTLTVATGIANIYGRDAQATASGQLALAEQSGGRFLLGLGVSHVPLVEGVRGHRYGKPVETMRGYLEAMRRNFAVARRDQTSDAVGMVSPVYASPGETFRRRANPYSKGASILHMLRRMLGDDLFFEGVHRYVAAHADTVVETDDSHSAGGGWNAEPPAEPERWGLTIFAPVGGMVP